eukprot:gene16681-19817_t
MSIQGETDVDKIIANLVPCLHPDSFVFCTTADRGLVGTLLQDEQLIAFMAEKEGFTVVLSKAAAEKYSLKFDYIARWLTLEVHSALEAVGLTAAFAAALAKENISANVVAGFFHDHLFVDERSGEKALEVLTKLSAKHAARVEKDA